MSFIVEPLYVAAVLCLLIAFAEWLSRKKHFRYLGSALIVILAAAVLADLRVLPSSSNAPALYDGIFNYIAPLAIFFLLLDVKLKDLRQAGAPMLLLFLLIGETVDLLVRREPISGCVSSCAETPGGPAFRRANAYEINLRHSVGGNLVQADCGFLRSYFPSFPG